MKVILSRKGMDSKSGGMASPICQTVRCYHSQFQIRTVGTAYKDLYYRGQSLEEIISQLCPKFDFDKKPDLSP